jgi:hypothetical protein
VGELDLIAGAPAARSRRSCDQRFCVEDSQEGSTAVEAVEHRRLLSAAYGLQPGMSKYLGVRTSCPPRRSIDVVMQIGTVDRPNQLDSPVTRRRSRDERIPSCVESS